MGTKRVMFTLGAGCLVFRKRVNILLGLRSEDVPYPNQWSIPGGHIEFGETPLQAAKRELLEEANMVAENGILVSAFTTYDEGLSRAHIIHLMRNVTGNEELIPGEGFSELKYFSLYNLPKNLFKPTMLALTQASINY